jgi:hypothetical protein
MPTVLRIGPYRFFSTLATGMSRHMFMLSVRTSCEILD